MPLWCHEKLPYVCHIESRGAEDRFIGLSDVILLCFDADTETENCNDLSMMVNGSVLFLLHFLILDIIELLETRWH